jgi:hypothetical protein
MTRGIKLVVASLFLLGLSASFLMPPAIAGATPAIRVAGPSACLTDLNRSPASIAMPNPVRLHKRFELGGAVFTPVPSGFEPVVTPLRAWRDFHELKQATATYKIILSRIRQNNPPRTNAAFKPQIVWLVLAQQVAFLRSPAPGTNYPRPPCAFGYSFWAINATSGKPIYGGGGSVLA